MMGYYIIAGLIFVVSLYVSNKLKSKFKHYSKVHLQNGMSGREIAEKMLRDNGITDVRVISTPGQLTDHYNPSKNARHIFVVLRHTSPYFVIPRHMTRL